MAWAVVHGLLAPLAAIGARGRTFGQGRFDEPIRVRRARRAGPPGRKSEHHGEEPAKHAGSQARAAAGDQPRAAQPAPRARAQRRTGARKRARTALLRDLGEMRDLIADLLESERIAAGHAAIAAPGGLRRRRAGARGRGGHPQGAALHLQLEDGDGPAAPTRCG